MVNKKMNQLLTGTGALLTLFCSIFSLGGCASEQGQVATSSSSANYCSQNPDDCSNHKDIFINKNQ